MAGVSASIDAAVLRPPLGSLAEYLATGRSRSEAPGPPKTRLSVVCTMAEYRLAQLCRQVWAIENSDADQAVVPLAFLEGTPKHAQII